MQQEVVFTGENKQCHHTPSAKTSFWGRYLDFFLHKDALYFKCDDTGRCTNCGATIRAPRIYYNPFLRIRYSLASLCGLSAAYGFSQMYSESIWRYFAVPLSICISVLFFRRCLTVAILAFFSWCPYDEATADMEQMWKAAKVERNRRGAMLLLGVCTNYFIVERRSTHALIGMIVFAFICVIIEYIREYRKCRTGDGSLS